MDKMYRLCIQYFERTGRRDFHDFVEMLKKKSIESCRLNGYEPEELETLHSLIYNIDCLLKPDNKSILKNWLKKLGHG